MLLTFSTPVIKVEKIARHANIIALLAGLVFVSHPVQIEAVTYIWQRAASMATLFYLASLCFYVKSRCAGDREGRKILLHSFLVNRHGGHVFQGNSNNFAFDGFIL